MAPRKASFRRKMQTTARQQGKQPAISRVKKAAQPAAPPQHRRRFMELVPKAGMQYKHKICKPLLGSDVHAIVAALQKKCDADQTKNPKAHADIALAEIFVAGTEVAVEAKDMTPIVFWEKVGQVVEWINDVRPSSVMKTVFKIIQARKAYKAANNGILDERAIGLTVCAVDHFLETMAVIHCGNMLLMSFYENPSLALETDDEDDFEDKFKTATIRASNDRRGDRDGGHRDNYKATTIYTSNNPCCDYEDDDKTETNHAPLVSSKVQRVNTEDHQSDDSDDGPLAYPVLRRETREHDPSDDFKDQPIALPKLRRNARQHDPSEESEGQPFTLAKFRRTACEHDSSDDSEERPLALADIQLDAKEEHASYNSDDEPLAVTKPRRLADGKKEVPRIKIILRLGTPKATSIDKDCHISDVAGQIHAPHDQDNSMMEGIEMSHTNGEIHENGAATRAAPFPQQPERTHEPVILRDWASLIDTTGLSVCMKFGMVI